MDFWSEIAGKDDRWSRTSRGKSRGDRVNLVAIWKWSRMAGWFRGVPRNNTRSVRDPTREQQCRVQTREPERDPEKHENSRGTREQARCAGFCGELVRELWSLCENCRRVPGFAENLCENCGRCARTAEVCRVLPRTCASNPRTNQVTRELVRVTLAASENQP